MNFKPAPLRTDQSSIYGRGPSAPRGAYWKHQSIIAEAHFIPDRPAFACGTRKRTGAQKAGLRYERRALRYLQQQAKKLGLQFIPSPWIKYRLTGQSGWKWCQPDGILFDFMGGKIVVVECKLRHTADAFVKMDSLYLPIMRLLFPIPLWKLSGVEFTPIFDCAVQLPVQIKLYKEVNYIPGESFGAVLWNPIQVAC